MRTIPNFENFDMNETITAVGFGMGGVQNFGFGGSTPQTGYSMNSIAGTVGQSADAIGTQAHDYEMNDNDDHTAEGYLTEAKKHVNESIDKAYESLSGGVVSEASNYEFNPNETAERLKRREQQNIERYRAAQEREDAYGIEYYKYRIAMDKIDLQKLQLMTQIHQLKQKNKK